MSTHFGDLPDYGRELLTEHLRIDFLSWPMKAPRWFSAWALDDVGDITGIFATEFKYPWEGYVTMLVRDPRCMSRRALRAIFTALFAQARRLTAEVEPHNQHALKQVRRMNFQYEGFRRLGLEGTRDVMTFGMLKNECPYLPVYVRPRPALLNVGDRVPVDPVVRRNHPPVSRVRADQLDLFGGQRGADVALTDVAPFEQIGLASAPADVARVDAMPNAAGMRGVHLAQRRAVRDDANETMDLPASTAVPHLRVASVVKGKRPKQAAVPGVGDRVAEKTFRGLHVEPPVVRA